MKQPHIYSDYCNYPSLFVLIYLYSEWISLLNIYQNIGVDFALTAEAGKAEINKSAIAADGNLVPLP